MDWRKNEIDTVNMKRTQDLPPVLHSAIGIPSSVPAVFRHISVHLPISVRQAGSCSLLFMSLPESKEKMSVKIIHPLYTQALLPMPSIWGQQYELRLS